MNTGEYIDILTKRATEYKKEAQKSIVRNNHMNEIEEGEQVQQRHIDATVVDFINFVGMKMGLDVGLYTEDLNKEDNDGEDV